MDRRSKTYNEVVVKSKNIKTVKSGIDIFDNFLSNDKGFIPGSSIMLTGDSGGGKSSICFWLQLMLKGFTSSFYSREMTASQIKKQMSRLGAPDSTATIADKGSCPTLNEYIEELKIIKPQLIIIDSLQFIVKEDYADMSEDAAAEFIIKEIRDFAERNNAALIVIGHVNKDGTFTGSNFIKHAFDAHLHLRYNKRLNERTLYWEKNRLGSVEETIYYTFDNNTINFFTEDEWNQIKIDKANEQISPYLTDHIKYSILPILKNYKKSHKNYKAYSKDLNKSIKEIGEECKKTIVNTEEEYELLVLKYINEVMTKSIELKLKHFNNAQ